MDHERTIELDTPVVMNENANALRAATERAERAEAELARLKAQQHPHTGYPAQPQVHQEAPHPQGHARDTGAYETADTAAHTPDEVHTEDLKQPPSPNTAANAPEAYPGTPVYEPGSANRAMAQHDGVDELRRDPMMAHLLDALDAGTDVGHYGRLTFAMVARHFLPHAEVVSWLTRDNDFNEDEAQQMLHQVEGRDYSPPRRERLLEWQREQDFVFIDAQDPDSGNLYRNLRFPQEIYQHIGHYQEAKSHS